MYFVKHSAIEQCFKFMTTGVGKVGRAGKRVKS